jgi:hypothetical protein
MSRSDGLWIFIAVVWLNVNGLLVDLLLWWLGLPMVTDWCRRNWIGSALILALQAVGVFGLAVHLQPQGGR